MTLGRCNGWLVCVYAVLRATRVRWGPGFADWVSSSSTARKNHFLRSSAVQVLLLAGIYRMPRGYLSNVEESIGGFEWNALRLADILSPLVPQSGQSACKSGVAFKRLCVASLCSINLAGRG